VGKTTLTVVLLHLLAKQGLKVLAVDLDPQAKLILCLTQNISEGISLNLTVYSSKALRQTSAS
jgi:cellulose biosynthesis protein BcsQ